MTVKSYNGTYSQNDENTVFPETVKVKKKKGFKYISINQLAYTKATLFIKRQTCARLNFK